MVYCFTRRALSAALPQRLPPITANHIHSLKRRAWIANDVQRLKLCRRDVQSWSSIFSTSSQEGAEAYITLQRSTTVSEDPAASSSTSSLCRSRGWPRVERLRPFRKSRLLSAALVLRRNRYAAKCSNASQSMQTSGVYYVFNVTVIVSPPSSLTTSACLPSSSLGDLHCACWHNYVYLATCYNGEYTQTMLTEIKAHSNCSATIICDHHLRPSSATIIRDHHLRTSTFPYAPLQALLLFIHCLMNAPLSATQWHSSPLSATPRHSAPTSLYDAPHGISITTRVSSTCCSTCVQHIYAPPEKLFWYVQCCVVM